MKILGLIPARGGSKGIPRKNIRPLNGKSLIQRAFDCAQSSEILDRIILSTEDLEIANIAKELGIEVPFTRPLCAARDESPMIDVALHALSALREAGYEPDALLLLQPDVPSRTPEHLVTAANLLQDNDSVCSVVPIPPNHSPHYVMKIDDCGNLSYFLPEGAKIIRRQDVPPAYMRDGTVFLTKTNIIQDKKSFYGRRCIPMHLTADEVLNLNSWEDWHKAERQLGSTESPL